MLSAPSEGGCAAEGCRQGEASGPWGGPRSPHTNRHASLHTRPPAQNATSIASRFRDLFGLELVLKQELGELTKARVGVKRERRL